MTPTENRQINIAGGSDSGKTGKINEDRYGVFSYPVVDAEDNPALLAIVADGIGGHNAGEVAAEMAVKIINDEMEKADLTEPIEVLEKAIKKASELINFQGEGKEDQQGMGTTVVCALVLDNKLYMSSVGNSRIYLMREGVMKQINKDHSWVQDAMDKGLLDPLRARKHPYAHIITKYLGSPDIVEVDSRLWLDPEESDAQALYNQGLELLKGDRLLLCSDGLNDMLYDNEIQELLSGNTIEIAVEKLIDQANEAGGKDNTTIIILDVD